MTKFGIGKFFKTIFSKEKEKELRDNPIILVNLIKSFNHGIYVCNPEDIKSSFTSSNIEDDRYVITAYARDLDETLEEDEYEEKMHEPHRLLVPRGNLILMAQGMMSNDRTIGFLFPNDSNLLPENFKDVASDWVTGRKSATDIIEVRRQLDKKNLVNIKKTASLVEAELESQIDKIKQKNKEELREKPHEAER